ncbi:type II and III secretion system protein family protein [Massilia consociata]|uniref:Type II and III secretion system protein family protein n=1 Tax=Massilia consociata TaxID=760117 RepID=A0ABV6FK47_9BURK
MSRIALLTALSCALFLSGAVHAGNAPLVAGASPDVSTAQPASRAAVRQAPRKTAGAPPAAVQPDAPQSLIMALGEVKLLPMQAKVRRVALGSGSVLSATTVDQSLLLIAEALGDTSLLVWTGGAVRHYQVQVVPRGLAGMRAKLEALVGDQKGITISQVGTELVLSGVAHKDVLARLAGPLDDMPGVINNIREDPGPAFARSVLFRLHFVEINRTLLESIGVRWDDEAMGPSLGLTGVAKNTGIYKNIPPSTGENNLLAPNPGFISRNGSTSGVFFGLATTIGSRLRLAITDGDARVLATPELTARSGGKARLQVGGEVPIPLAGAFGATTVEFKPYGMLFSIEPHIDANDVITAKLSTELSQIDPSVSVAGIPGFITRTTDSEISVKPGEVVALSGLVNSELSSAIDRVPALSRIPLFGRLFRSDDFRNRKTELVVFVESEIINAGDGLAAALRQRGEEGRREFEEKSGQDPLPTPFRQQLAPAAAPTGE